jgi:hypothetical protein
MYNASVNVQINYILQKYQRISAILNLINSYLGKLYIFILIRYISICIFNILINNKLNKHISVNM